MARYRAGTVTVTAGSPEIIGAGGAAFVDAGIRPGDNFYFSGGLSQEIASVPSNTRLILVENAVGAAGGGQAYSIGSTQSFAKYLGDAFTAIKDTFQGVIDTVLQGMFPAGTVAAPGLRSTIDSDTGVRWLGNNGLSLVTGGVDRLTIDGAGAIVTTAGIRLPINSAIGNNPDGDKFNYGAAIVPSYGFAVTNSDSGVPKVVMSGYYGLDFFTLNALRGRIDSGGNLLMGVTASVAGHQIRKPVSEGAEILRVDASDNGYSAIFAAVTQGGAGGLNAALALGRHSVSLRSLAAGGQIVANGADFGELLLKRAECGKIEKGDVCGVDLNGDLTKTWSQAHSYTVKSTRAGLVGNDVFFDREPPKHPGDEPVAPSALGAPPQRPAAPGEQPSGDDAEALLAWFHATQAMTAYAAELAHYTEALEAYPARQAAFLRDHAVWTAAVAEFEAKSAEHETWLKGVVDRIDTIAFCGQVPVNVDAETLATCEAALAEGTTCYLVAVRRGTGIGVKAVRVADMTLDDLLHKVARVWAVKNGRPWADVQHG